VTKKADTRLFILFQDAQTFTVSSARCDILNDRPDQVARIVGGDGILYLCENGYSNAGVHSRDTRGRFVTMLKARSKNTGLVR